MFYGSLLLVLLSLSCLQSFTTAQSANGAGLCCFAFPKKPFPAANVVSVEYTRFDCPVPGAIFTTRRRFRMCVDPEMEWVQQVIKTKTSASTKTTN